MSRSRKAVRFTLCAVSLVWLHATAALAVEPDEILPDPALEARARALAVDLRCLVCQNQSIDDSNAPLARDLRLLVRERLRAGDNDAEVRNFIVARYGDFVLLKPPFRLGTLLLWLAPLLALLLAAFAVRGLFASTARTPAAKATTRLTADEEQKLATLLAQDDDQAR